MARLFRLGDLSFGFVVPDGELKTSFDPLTVVMSIFVSVLGCYRFVDFLREANGLVAIEAALAALVYGGSGVWSLHFLGMSAVTKPQCIKLEYRSYLVALSCIVPVLTGFLAYCLMASRQSSLTVSENLRQDRRKVCVRLQLLLNCISRRSPLCIIVVTLAKVLGIAVMHYAGCWSMDGVEQLHHLWGILGVVVSCVALNMLAVALFVILTPKHHASHLAISLLLTAGVAVPHYTSAATVHYYPSTPVSYERCRVAHLAVDNLIHDLGADTLDGGDEQLMAFVVAGINIALMLPASSMLHKRQQQLRSKREADVERVMRVVTGGLSMSFPMVTMRADRFLRLGRLVYHEAARDARLLTFFDVPAAAEEHFVALLSHQWLGWWRPDPEGVQYAAMRRATEQLLERENLSPKQLYLWVDTFSIPQANGIGAAQNAIDSLATYSAVSSALVVVAPTAVHQNTGEVCNLATYMKRCWCRAEQSCHILSRGSARYYIMEDEALRTVDKLEDVDLQALFVFQGELTCCRRKHVGGMICDRERLVDTYLGLIFHMLSGSGRHSEQLPQLSALITAHRDRLFPRSIKVEYTDHVATRELFGELIQRMEEMVAAGALQGTRSRFSSGAVGKEGQLPAEQHKIGSFEPEDVQRLCEELVEAERLVFEAEWDLEAERSPKLRGAR